MVIGMSGPHKPAGTRGRCTGTKPEDGAVPFVVLRDATSVEYEASIREMGFTGVPKFPAGEYHFYLVSVD